jgi:hypothetical protein
MSSAARARRSSAPDSSSRQSARAACRAAASAVRASRARLMGEMKGVVLMGRGTYSLGNLCALRIVPTPPKRLRFS